MSETARIERRAVAAQFDVRANDDGTVAVEGYAAIFDAPAYGEVVRRSAFTRALKDEHDVRLLVNHDGVPLARTASGTLDLTVDSVGLRIKAPSVDVAGNPTAQELVSAMARGDIDQMSFAFIPVRETSPADSDEGLRELLEVELWDVSVVTYPWYEDTSAELNEHGGLVLLRSTPPAPVAHDGLDEVAAGQIPTDERERARIAAAGRAVELTVDDLWTRVARALKERTGDNTYDFASYLWDLTATWLVARFYNWGDAAKPATGYYQIGYALDDDGQVALAGDEFAEVLPRTVYDPAPPPDDTDDPPAPEGASRLVRARAQHAHRGRKLPV